MTYLVTSIFYNTDRAKAQSSRVFTDAQLMNNVFVQLYEIFRESHHIKTISKIHTSQPQTAHLPYSSKFRSIHIQIQIHSFHNSAGLNWPHYTHVTQPHTEKPWKHMNTKILEQNWLLETCLIQAFSTQEKCSGANYFNSWTQHPIPLPLTNSTAQNLTRHTPWARQPR